jgi:transglutaminase-like putative cysteine protease
LRRLTPALSIAAGVAILAALSAPPPVLSEPVSSQPLDSANPSVAASTGVARPGDNYPVQRRIRYSFTLQNSTGEPLQDASLTAYAPVSVTSTQRVEGLTTSFPTEVQVDASGNQILRFRIERLAPYAAKVITVEAHLALSDRPVPQAPPAPLLEAYTKPERYIESDDGRIKAIAQTLKGEGPTRTARNIFDWLRQNLRSLPFTPEDRGALQALASKSGDCTEYAYLFVALARASGIPARAMGGFVAPESGVLDPRDYHNWAEFYADGAWHLADPQRGRFEKNPSHYVAMRVISATLPNQLGSSHRYSAAGRGLRVSMN